LEELGKDDAVGPAGPDQLRPETNKRKSWQAVPEFAISVPEVSIVPGQVEEVAPRHDRREKRNEAEQNAGAYDRPTPAYSAFEIPWRDQLLECLLKMKPAAFERLCQRILKESGFIKVDVTGRSGDGGVDGIGVLPLNLLSFQGFPRGDGGQG
jgi:restriction system protein